MAMDPSECPLPEVAANLKQYIKSRDEVACVRHGLQRHLEAQAAGRSTPLNNSNLVGPLVSKPDARSASLSGVRKAYLKALEAHVQAQERYETLRTELEQMKHPQIMLDSSDGGNAAGKSSAEYLSLLRQQERHRKFKVVETALSSIITNDNTITTGNLEDVIKDKIGELPTPPGLQPTQSRDPEVDIKTMALKKAVLSTKQRVDIHSKRSVAQSMSVANGNATEAEIAGLQNALQELTAWMEDHLAIIAEAEPEAQVGAEDAADADSAPTAPTTLEDVEARYEQYLEARQRMVHGINMSENDSNIDDAEWLAELNAPRQASMPPPTSKANAAAIVPFITALVEAKQREHSQVQQTAHVRKQVSAAEETTARLIQRLADESHLVHPGASHGKDWARAATEAGSATRGNALERAQSGEDFAKAAQESHDTISTLPSSLGRI